MKHKKLFISLTAVFSAVIFLAVFLIVWFFCDIYRDFDSFNEEFEIPGLDDGAVPQGLGNCNVTYEKLDENGKNVSVTQQFFFISAYMADGSPSRIYVTGKDEGYVGYVTMKDSEGKDFYGHCGGIALNTNTLWVSCDSTVYVAKASAEYKSKNISREIMEKARLSQNPVVTNEDGTTETKDFSITFTQSFNANCNASFLFYFDDSRYTSVTYDRLYVGEFYRNGNYETDAAHRLKTPNGYNNTAFMYEYSVSSSSDNEYGLITISDTGVDKNNQVPKIQKIISLPEKIQGIAFSGREGYGTNDGILVLSQSYGLSNSHLLCFDWQKVTASSNSVLYSQLSVDGSGVGKTEDDYEAGEKIKENELRRNSFVYEGIYRTIGGKTVAYTDSTLRVYYVDKSNEEMFVNDYSIPSMSEGMCVVTPPGANNSAITRIYVLFESAGKKYKMFVRERLNHVYSFIPHEK